MGFDWQLQPEHCSPPVPPAGLDSCPAPTSKDGQLQREAFWPIRDCKTCLWHDFGSKHKFEGHKLAPGDHCHFLNQVLMKAKVVCHTQVVWFVFQHFASKFAECVGDELKHHPWNQSIQEGSGNGPALFTRQECYCSSQALSRICW